MPDSEIKPAWNDLVDICGAAWDMLHVSATEERDLGEEWDNAEQMGLAHDVLDMMVQIFGTAPVRDAIIQSKEQPSNATERTEPTQDGLMGFEGDPGEEILPPEGLASLGLMPMGGMRAPAE